MCLSVSDIFCSLNIINTNKRTTKSVISYLDFWGLSKEKCLSKKHGRRKLDLELCVVIGQYPMSCSRSKKSWPVLYYLGESTVDFWSIDQWWISGEPRVKSNIACYTYTTLICNKNTYRYMHLYIFDKESQLHCCFEMKNG